MRVFAALPVEGAARTELEQLLVDFERRGLPVKWVRNHGLHVTVKFLGEIEPDRLDAIQEKLAAACAGTPPLSFRATEIGAFPSFQRARILWAGYESESALELMVHRVEQGLEALGFPVEGRAFRPHVTLGRVREGARLPPEEVARLESARLSAGFTADRLVLFESHPGPGGSTYAELTSFALHR
ncbi:MAG TPA: RNA 2',3'-cyclic phosphodiesterase [Gemmatimonadales bacterium]|jgi:2'-5' RNA ligase